ncbi:30S ribosomal protein S17e, partial [Candidatus Woesearchaeota archaeon]|nr:30S ribosomal protein S17e [Candidatus Woesearchaeota archaeon]
LIELYADRFRKEFDENKKSFQGVLTYKSKKIRNVIAGYITRAMKKREQDITTK